MRRAFVRNIVGGITFMVAIAVIGAHAGPAGTSAFVGCIALVAVVLDRVNARVFTIPGIAALFACAIVNELTAYDIVTHHVQHVGAGSVVASLVCAAIALMSRRPSVGPM